MRALILSTFGLGLMSCSAATPAATSPEQAPLTPVDGLVDWIQRRAQAEDVVRIPVVVTRTALGIDAAELGGPGLPAEPRPSVQLDDSRLGVSLMTRLRSLCPDLDDPCAVWLDGVFGRALPGPRPAHTPTPTDAGPFVVHAVGDLVTAADAPLTAQRLP